MRTSRTNLFKITIFLFAALLITTNVSAQRNQGTKYPSLESQLTQKYHGHFVEQDTELAKLIAANQDFEMLRADEFSDKRGLPPWLRVFWRKAHPEGDYNAEDPTKGYPLVLKEVLEWMITHQDLKRGPGKGEEEEGGNASKSEIVDSLSANDYAPKNNIGNKDGQGVIRALIGANVRASGLQSVPRSESDVRINFFDPQKILIGSNNIGGTGQQAIYRSTDGGATWAQSFIPFQSGDAFHSDPTVDWTNDGRAYSSTLGINNAGSVLRLHNHVSTDNGATWTFDATASGAQTSVDKQMVWTDKSATSPFFGQTYAIWHNGNPGFVNRRTAGAGGTWLAAPIQISGAESTGTAIGADIKSNSAGDVFAFWPTTTNRRIIMRKSTDGGNTYAPFVEVATTFDGFDIGVPSFNDRRAFIYVSAGAYRNASKNMVYAAWTDLSGDAGCTAAANEPGANVASTCKMRVFFSRSTDGGATWSAKVKLNNQAGLNDQFSQWLAVDETTGAIGVIYQDTVADPGRLKSDVWYQRSFDDGVTWSAAEKVTTAMTDETPAAADANQYGDYNGLSSYAGILFPSWTDRRDGVREEIYTAKITDPACTAPGAPTAITASPTAANQVTVGWAAGAPAPATYNVYRAPGTCAAPGAYTLLAADLATTSYVDNTVSGGSTYSYKITGKDGTGGCESTQSTCSEATATGLCTLAPTFAGLTTATNAAGASCQANLSWSAASPGCSGPISYNVYRSTVSGFVPGPANLIGTTNSTTYNDTNSLINGTTYYYVVRAKDTGNNVIETNTVQKSVVPSGPVTLSTLTETFEGAGGFDNAGWTNQALSGATIWTWDATQSQTPTHSWKSTSLTTVSDRVLVSPPFGANASTTLSFWHTFAFESATTASCFDGGTIEYTTDGVTWTVMPDANFTAGGFTGTVSSSFSNPIGGKRAYCNGTIGPMTQVQINLASLAGNTVQVRWHEGDDSSVAVTGWFVDSVTIANAGVAGACTPTASGVDVTGRVFASAEGRGVRNAVVTITDENGNARSTVTGALGTYRFAEVETGHTYIVSVRSRRFTFAPQVVQITDNISGLDFTPEP